MNKKRDNYIVSEKTGTVGKFVALQIEISPAVPVHSQKRSPQWATQVYRTCPQGKAQPLAFFPLRNGTNGMFSRLMPLREHWHQRTNN